MNHNATRLVAHRGIRIAYAHLRKAAEHIDYPIGHEPNGVMQFDALILWDLAETLRHQLDRIAREHGRPAGLALVHLGNVSQYARAVHRTEVHGVPAPHRLAGRAVNYAAQVADYAAGWAGRLS